MLLASCASCGREAYPAPLRCHRCGSMSFAWVGVGSGVVEELTLRPGDSTATATVLLGTDARVIARVPATSRPGDRLPVRGAAEPGAAWVPPDPSAPPDSPAP